MSPDPVAAGASIKIQVRRSPALVSVDSSVCPLCGNYIVNFTTKSKPGQDRIDLAKKVLPQKKAMQFN